TEQAQEARLRLEAVRQQTQEALLQLQTLRLESQEAERRLQEVRADTQQARQELEEGKQRVEEQRRESDRGHSHNPPGAAGAPPATTEAEGHNELGVTAVAGVVIAAVMPDTPAQRAGLRRGDRVISVAGQSITTPPQLREAIWGAGGGETTLSVAHAA